MDCVSFYEPSYKRSFYGVCQIFSNIFSRAFHICFRTMKMVTTNLKYDSNQTAFLSDFLKLSPSGLKDLEKERVTLRFHQPLIMKFKEAAKAKNMSVNLYLEQAMVEKLKIDKLNDEFNQDIEDLSFLKNKDIDELAYLKQLLKKTLQDNHKLKQSVDNYRRTNNGRDFEAFTLF